MAAQYRSRSLYISGLEGEVPGTKNRSPSTRRGGRGLESSRCHGTEGRGVLVSKYMGERKKRENHPAKGGGNISDSEELEDIRHTRKLNYVLEKEGNRL